MGLLLVSGAKGGLGPGQGCAHRRQRHLERGGDFGVAIARVAGSSTAR